MATKTRHRYPFRWHVLIPALVLLPPSALTTAEYMHGRMNPRQCRELWCFRTLTEQKAVKETRRLRGTERESLLYCKDHFPGGEGLTRVAGIASLVTTPILAGLVGWVLYRYLTRRSRRRTFIVHSPPQ